MDLTWEVTFLLAEYCQIIERVNLKVLARLILATMFQFRRCYWVGFYRCSFNCR